MKTKTSFILKKLMIIILMLTCALTANAEAIKDLTGGGGSIPNHNDLPGLNVGDYQHLTQAEKAKALADNFDNNKNTFVGSHSLEVVTTGYANCAFGDTALSKMESGDGNVAIGRLAGNGGLIGYTDSVSDSYMTFVGTNASRNNNVANTTVFTNSTALGAGAKVTKSNQMVFGDSNIIENIFHGNFELDNDVIFNIDDTATFTGDINVEGDVNVKGATTIGSTLDCSIIGDGNGNATFDTDVATFTGTVEAHEFTRQGELLSDYILDIAPSGGSVDTATITAAIDANEASITQNINDIDINSNKIDTNITNINNNDTAIGVNTTSITQNVANIDNNSNAITDNTNSINKNIASITLNIADINTNTSNITQNVSDINTNTNNITSNATNINNNATSITQNTNDISTNASNIALNTANINKNIASITLNIADIDTNTSNITLNATDINNNSTAIAGNVTAIGINTASITNNIGDISANTNNVALNVASITDLYSQMGDVSTALDGILNP